MEHKKSICELAPEERPYEKCMMYGPEALADHELLAVILRSGSRSLNVLELAKEVLQIGSPACGLVSLYKLSFDELMSIPGIGSVKAAQIRCISELSKRMSGQKARADLSLNRPDTIASCYMERLRHEETEQIYLLMLDKKNHLIAERCISKGTVDMSLASPREILLEALHCRAVNLILIHNHPSGDPTPSQDDLYLTERVRNASELIGLALLDHIIVGDHTYFSFAENNM